MFTSVQDRKQLLTVPQDHTPQCKNLLFLNQEVQLRERARRQNFLHPCLQVFMLSTLESLKAKFPGQIP